MFRFSAGMKVISHRDNALALQLTSSAGMELQGPDLFLPPYAPLRFIKPCLFNFRLRHDPGLTINSFIAGKCEASRSVHKFIVRKYLIESGLKLSGLAKACN